MFRSADRVDQEVADLLAQDEEEEVLPSRRSSRSAFVRSPSGGRGGGLRRLGLAGALAAVAALVVLFFAATRGRADKAHGESSTAVIHSESPRLWGLPQLPASGFSLPQLTLPGQSAPTPAPYGTGFQSPYAAAQTTVPAPAGIAVSPYPAQTPAPYTAAAPSMTPAATPPTNTQGYGGGMSNQQSYDCETGYHKSGWVEKWTEPQMAYCCKTMQRGCKAPRRMSFYLYRAQSDDNYPMANVNMGDLPGVMWYLHNEVVVSTPRKFNVTRILRFRVTMMTTEESYAQTHMQFSKYTAFDSGKCTVPGCTSFFQQTGYAIGCQNTASSQGLGNYVSLQSVPCTPPNCKEGTWYSLPGPCPDRPFGYQKEDGCNLTETGGSCQFEYGDSANGGVTGFEEAPVTGKKDCTYYAKWAGQIYLNDLIGLATVDNTLGSPTAGQDMHTQIYTQWWQQGNQEYSVALDDGVQQGASDTTSDSDTMAGAAGTAAATTTATGLVASNYHFWAGRNDQEKCAERIRKIQEMFDQKFTFYPLTASMGEAPPCDAA